MAAFWILVADSSQARIFSSSSPSSELTEVETLVHPEARQHAQELTSDLPGKQRDSSGSGHHGVGSKTDPHQREVASFAKEIAQRLKTACSSNEYANLVVVSEPSFLGTLRTSVDDQVKKTVTLEVSKNLTKHSPADIRKHLPQYLPYPLSA